MFSGRVYQDSFNLVNQVSSEQEELVAEFNYQLDKFLAAREQLFLEFDRLGEQSTEYINQLKELGLFSLIVPEEYGGLSLGARAYSRVVAQTSYYDAATSLTIGAHSSIGIKALLLFGNEEQKRRYLPRLATGELIAAFCLTESGSGSDAASIKTNAELKGDDWILNGEKIWITNGGIADFFTVFARTNSESGRLSCFMVERSFGGVMSGKKEDKMGIRASNTTTVSFENVKVPKENLIGEVGQGFKIAMAVLNNGRTGLGGGCVGGIRRCLDLAVNHAKQRRQFGRPLIEFELINEKINTIKRLHLAAESVVELVGGLIDNQAEDYSVEAAISKVFSTEALWRASYEALQIAGGSGFMKDYIYEKITRDSRINMIFEGTNEILRLYIGLNAFKAVGANLSKMTRRSFKGNFAGALAVLFEQLRIWTIGVNIPVRTENEHEARQANLYLNPRRNLKLATNILVRKGELATIRYGKKLVEKQLLTAGMADALINLFVAYSIYFRKTPFNEEYQTLAAEAIVNCCRTSISVLQDL